jgi:hypothetical protein
MSERTASRRTVLKTVGAALGVAAVPATVSAGEQSLVVRSLDSGGSKMSV